MGRSVTVGGEGTGLYSPVRVSTASTTGRNDVIGAAILGIVAGVIGRALMPGDPFEHMSGPRSWLVSIALGLVGAAVGYLIFTVALGIGDTDIFDLGGLLSAVIGVIIVLGIASFALRRSGGGSRPATR
jgi:uncharacterized membrane protein YeaQ/YmgE (transglycosylase-associated protein family)